MASDTATVTGTTASGIVIDDDRAAGAPTGLIASRGSGYGEIDLSWSAPADTGVFNGTDPAAVTGYQYRQAESSAGLASAAWTDSGPGTNLTVTGLKGGGHVLLPSTNPERRHSRRRSIQRS